MMKTLHVFFFENNHNIETLKNLFLKFMM